MPPHYEIPAPPCPPLAAFHASSAGAGYSAHRPLDVASSQKFVRWDHTRPQYRPPSHWDSRDTAPKFPQGYSTVRRFVHWPARPAALKHRAARISPRHGVLVNTLARSPAPEASNSADQPGDTPSGPRISPNHWRSAWPPAATARCSPPAGYRGVLTLENPYRSPGPVYHRSGTGSRDAPGDSAAWWPGQCPRRYRRQRQTRRE